MHYRTQVLETIYEADEDTISNEDSYQYIPSKSRLSNYMCWCVVVGCGLIVALMMALSLNSSILTGHSKLLSNTPMDPNDRLKLSSKIIEHFAGFSNEINERLNFPPNTLTFTISSIDFNSSFETLNQQPILAIYSRLTHLHSCSDNTECVEDRNLILNTTFTKLLNFLNAIELNFYPGGQIQLDRCDLIENPTTTTFVSIVSMTIKDKIDSEIIMTLDYDPCRSIEPLASISDNMVDLSRQEEAKAPAPISIIVDNPKLARKAAKHKPKTNSEEKRNADGNKACLYSKSCKTSPRTQRHKISKYSPDKTGAQYILI